MSHQATTWVFEDAPDVPPHLVAPLLGLANHADHNGKGAYISKATLAWYTRKNKYASRDDLDSLERLGLIRRGDQRMVLHLPPDSRPVVYDLAMERCRPPRPDRKPAGRPKKKPQLNAPEEIGGAYTPPGLIDENRGGVQTKSGGCTDEIGGVPTPPEPSFEPPLNQPPPPPADTEPAGRRAPRPRTGGEKSNVDRQPPAAPGGVAAVAALAGELYAQRRWPRVRTIRALEAAMAAGHTWAEAELVMRRIAADPSTDGPGRLMAPGLPAEYWTSAAAELRPPRPPWCGHPDCHEDTRHRVVEVGGSPRGAKCPACHPDLAAATAGLGPAG